jgi:membrane protease YdiL (CAAX protease family)
MVYPDPVPARDLEPRLGSDPGSEPVPEPGTGPDPIAEPRSITQTRLIALGEILLCSSLPTQILIGYALFLAGVPARDEAGELALPFVAALLGLDSIVLIALMVALTRAHGESPRALWLGDRSILVEFGLGLLLAPLVLVFVAVVMGLLMRVPWLHNVDQNPLEQLAKGGPYDAIVLGVIAAFAGGIREELQRAFLLRRFEQHLGGATVGIIVLSVAFGLGHFIQGRDAAITTGLLGMIWAIIYVRRRSCVAAVVSHVGFNSMGVLRLALGRT